VRTIENATLMIEYMQAHDFDATKVESYVIAYKALVEDGKLTPARRNQRTTSFAVIRAARYQNASDHSGSGRKEGSDRKVF